MQKKFFSRACNFWCKKGILGKLGELWSVFLHISGNRQPKNFKIIKFMIKIWQKKFSKIYTRVRRKHAFFQEGQNPKVIDDARAKFFYETNLGIGLRAGKNLGVRAHAYTLIFLFFQNFHFSIDSRKKEARAPRSWQTSIFFQILKILHLNYLHAKFYSLIWNRKKS